MLETWFVQIAFLVPGILGAVDSLAAHLGGAGTIQRIPTIVTGHPAANLVLATLSYLQVGVVVPLALLLLSRTGQDLPTLGLTRPTWRRDIWPGAELAVAGYATVVVLSIVLAPLIARNKKLFFAPAIGHLPQYYLQELCAGIITTTPIVLIVIPAVPFLWRRNRALATVVISLALVGALSMLLSSAYFFQYTMRYETAFASFFVLAAVLSWLAMTRGRFRRLLGAVGSVALIYGCVVGVAISFYGYYDLLRVNDSGTYWAMARLTSPLPTLATMVEGHPDIVRVIATTQCAAAPSLGSEYCATSGNSGTFNINGNRYPFASAPTEVDIVSPSSGKWTLTSRFSRTFFLPKDARVTFLIRNGTHQTVVPLRQAAVHGIPLTLHMGLNRILIDANSPYIPPLIPVLTGQGVSLRGR